MHTKQCHSNLFSPENVLTSIVVGIARRSAKSQVVDETLVSRQLLLVKRDKIGDPLETDEQELFPLVRFNKVR